MIKSKAAKGKASITFTVDPQVGAQVAAVCGDWNDWSPGADVMSQAPVPRWGWGEAPPFEG